MADPTSEPEDPGSQSAPGEAASAHAVNASHEAQPQDEGMRKFREALERKRTRETGGAGTGRDKEAGKIHGSHGPAHSRRSFRRKSGG